jgi:glycosyltransferase involved in cell wall biosynthesis
MELFEKGLVSIIIPVFNRESLLPETLDSILGQTYVNWECIIVDDGSTDASLKVAKGYAMKDNRFKVYRRPWYKKKGANSCRNYGFKLSKGEFIQWFDSDDIMKNEMIEKFILNFRSSFCKMVVCRSSYFKYDYNDSTEGKRVSIRPTTNNPAFEFLNSDFLFQTSQAFFQKIIFEGLKKPFNEKLFRHQESVLFIRLLLTNQPIHYLEDVLVLIRYHRTSIGANYMLKSYSQKLKVDIPAFWIINNLFLATNSYENDVRLYFKSFFYQALRRCPLFSESFWFLFLNLFLNNCFFSRKELLKILQNRLYK